MIYKIIIIHNKKTACRLVDQTQFAFRFLYDHGSLQFDIYFWSAIPMMTQLAKILLLTRKHMSGAHDFTQWLLGPRPNMCYWELKFCQPQYTWSIKFIGWLLRGNQIREGLTRSNFTSMSQFLILVKGASE